METYTDLALLDLQGAIAALPLSGQIKFHKPAVISEQPSQLVPESHQQSPNELHFEHPAKLKDSSAEQPLLAVKPCLDNRKASLSFADNEALSERVRGIEPVSSESQWEKLQQLTSAPDPVAAYLQLLNDTQGHPLHHPNWSWLISWSTGPSCRIIFARRS
jgi:hypothetical protein